MISDNASSNKGVSKEVVIDLWQLVGQSRGFNKQIMVTYNQNSLISNQIFMPLLLLIKHIFSINDVKEFNKKVY